jgi:5-methylcytosine-specific restriction protein A
MASRRPDWIAKRKKFPKSVLVEVLRRSGNMCEMEGCTAVGSEFDHIKPLAIGGDDSLENCRLLCRKCNAALGVETAKQVAKADRAGGRSGQHARRTRAKEAGTYRGIPRREFDKRFKKKLSGEVVARDQ